LYEAQIKKRIAFDQWWRKNHVSQFGKMPILFTDEKLFTVNGGLNKQNDRIYATSREQANNYGGNFKDFYF
jgi:hypothetical protein